MSQPTPKGGGRRRGVSSNSAKKRSASKKNASANDAAKKDDYLSKTTTKKRIKTLKNSSTASREVSRQKDDDKNPEATQPATEFVTVAERFIDHDRPVSQAQIQCFESFTRDAVNKGVMGILEEYHTHLKPFIPVGISKKAFEANAKKNRYADVICSDNSRVILRNQPSDYIHANWVRGDPLINSFICTQGPTMDTIKDFWRMCSQELVSNIICLCETTEQGREKCQQYWPREEGCTVEWPGIQIKNVKVDNSDSTTVISTLELVMDKKEKMVLKHHHWRSWPDKSVPASVLAPFRLLKSVRNSPRPTVVHCSAGIGRTGTIVALEMCAQQLFSENKLSVLDTVKVLRHFRMHSVQTDLQYLYLFRCLLTFSHKYKAVPQDCMPKYEEFDKGYQTVIDLKIKDKPEKYSPLAPVKMPKSTPAS